VDAKGVNVAQLWDADAYLASGKCPWTIFAYPASLADERHLPSDGESVRYLAALLAAGARVGVWYLPASQTVYFACPIEEKDRIESVVNELEQRGEFPENFARDHCEHLFQSASKRFTN
jgi:hypothetical protein